MSNSTGFEIPSGLASKTRQIDRNSMKQILLFLITVGVLFQTGCANHPSIDEQSREEQKTDQTIKQSTAFASGLPQ